MSIGGEIALSGNMTLKYKYIYTTKNKKKVKNNNEKCLIHAFFETHDVDKRVTIQMGQAIEVQTPGAFGAGAAQCVRGGAQEGLERARPRERS